MGEKSVLISPHQKLEMLRLTLHNSKYLADSATNSVFLMLYRMSKPFRLNYVMAIRLLFFNLFLVVLGLHCCTRAFSSCGERGLLFIAVRGLLIEVASLVAEHGLQECGLQ